MASAPTGGATRARRPAPRASGVLGAVARRVVKPPKRRLIIPRGLARKPLNIRPNTPAIGKPPTTSTTPTGDITRVRSYNDLLSQSNQDIDTELQGELGPLQSGLSGLDTREGRARSELESFYGELQPYATESAKRMRDLNDQTYNKEKEIYAATSTRLNALRQSQAQEAQDLAQKMGGPVAMDKFTSGVDPQIQEQTGLGAVGLMYSADIGAGDVAASEDFAGRVLPAVQREDVVKSHNAFEDQRKTIRDQITNLQASKSSKVNARLNDLMTQERSYALQKTQSKLDQIKANRDWLATQHTLKNDDARLGLSKGQFGLQEAGVTGKYKGKPTLENIKLTVQQQNDAAKLGLSNAQYKESLRHHQETEATARGRLANAQQSNAIHLVDSLTNPTSGKPVTVTKKRYLANDSPELTRAITGKGQYFYDSKQKKWYHYDKVSMTGAQYAQSVGAKTAISDPKELYGYLIQNGIPSKMALGVVRTKTNRPKWKP